MIEAIILFATPQQTTIEVEVAIARKSMTGEACKAYQKDVCYYREITEPLILLEHKARANKQVNEFWQTYFVAPDGFDPESSFAQWARGLENRGKLRKENEHFNEEMDKLIPGEVILFPHNDYGYWKKATVYLLYELLRQGQSVERNIGLLIESCSVKNADMRNFGHDPTSHVLIEYAYALETARGALSDLVTNGNIQNIRKIIRETSGYADLTMPPIVTGGVVVG